MTPMMTTKERIFQSVIFELILILLLVPVIFMITAMNVAIAPEKALITGGVGSLNALILNYFYNLAFDQLFGSVRIERKTPLRLFHAVGFEATMLITYLPFLMWYLSISFIEALLLDAVLITLALIYTYIFHWVYDHVRHRAMCHREKAHSNP